MKNLQIWTLQESRKNLFYKTRPQEKSVEEYWETRGISGQIVDKKNDASLTAYPQGKLLNGSQLAKIKKYIPYMPLQWNL